MSGLSESPGFSRGEEVKCVHSDGFEHEAPMDEDGFATTCGTEEEAG